MRNLDVFRCNALKALVVRYNKITMKSLFFVTMLMALFLSLFSCRKDKQYVSSQVVGQWKWMQSSGGFIGNQVVGPAAGNSVTLTLKKDFTYVASLNNQPQSNGIYSFTTIQSGDTVIRFDKMVQIERLFLQEEQLLEPTENTRLALFDYSTSEGHSHQFQRLK